MNKQDFKVLMVSINNVWRYGNIGLDQLVGYLREKEFKVDINYFKKNDSVENIYTTIEKDYHVFGFSVNSSNYAKCCEISKKLKENNPNAIIVFGGGLTTRYYKEIFAESRYVDYITLGDGEKPTEFLFNNLIFNDKYLLQEKTNNSYIASRKDCIDKCPYLNKEIKWLPAFDYYTKDSHERNSRKVHCIQTKNNVCTGNCSFCTERHGCICYKDINSIIMQIKYVHEKFGVKKFYFTDDNILDPNNDFAKNRLRDLCYAIKNTGYKLAFQCYIKAISLNDTPEDNELLDLMHSTGFVEIFIGLESGNSEDLIIYNKHTKVDDNYRIMRLIKEHGMVPIIGFIGFNPYSTLDKIRQNFKFLCDIKCTYLFNYLYSFVVINKYTALYEKTKEDNLLLSTDDEYINLKYTYKDKSVIPILNYIENEMLPRLNSLDYELDWVTYSFYEHKIWYNDVVDYDCRLKQMKEEDFNVIKKYLGILFIDNDLEKFKLIENDFWNHFINRETELKEMYDYFISLHEM